MSVSDEMTRNLLMQQGGQTPRGDPIVMLGDDWVEALGARSLTILIWGR